MGSNLLKYKKYATISRVFIAIAIIYLLMVVVKGLFIYTDEPTNRLSSLLNNWTTLIINKTYFVPINYLWEYIPNIGINNINLETLYIIFIPPFVIFLIASLYIDTYKHIKRDKWISDKEVAKQIRIKKGLEEAGFYENQSLETVNINVNSNEKKEIQWHNKWWGKIIIPLLVLMLATAIGLRTIT